MSHQRGWLSTHSSNKSLGAKHFLAHFSAKNLGRHCRVGFLLWLALLAACGRSEPVSESVSHGPLPRIPVARTVIPLPKGVTGLLTESCTWTRDGAAIVCPFVMADESVQVGSIYPDGSKFQCITCNNPPSGQPAYLYTFSDLKRFFYATQPGDAQNSGTSSGANVTPYIGECSPSLLHCEQLTITKVSMPTIVGDLNDREPRLSPDGLHYIWTIVRTDGFLLLMGDLTSSSGGYAVKNVRVLNAAPLPTTAEDWALRGAFTEGKSFDHGQRFVFATTREGGVGLDDYVVDLSTGSTTRITHNLEWDEDAQFDPTSRYLILGSSRRMHNNLRSLALASLPSFLDSTFLTSTTSGVLGTELERHHALEKWLTTPEIEAAGGDGEMLNDKTGGWASGASKSPWSPDGTRAAWGERGPNGTTRLVLASFPTLPKQPLLCADPSKDPTCITPTPTWAPLVDTYLPLLPGLYLIPGPKGGIATFIYGGTVLGVASSVSFVGYTDDDGRVLNGSLSFVGTSREGLTQLITSNVTFSGTTTGQSTINITASGPKVCGEIDTVLGDKHLHTNIGEWNPDCGFTTPAMCPNGADADATDSLDCSQDGLPNRWAAPRAN